MSAATASQRVGHLERDDVLDRLQAAYAEGRLDRDEFDERLQGAMAARTRADLDGLLVDLPGPPRGAAAEDAQPTGLATRGALPLLVYQAGRALGRLLFCCRPST